jgi:hypothetical protein
MHSLTANAKNAPQMNKNFGFLFLQYAIADKLKSTTAKMTVRVCMKVWSNAMSFSTNQAYLLLAVWRSEPCCLFHGTDSRSSSASNQPQHFKYLLRIRERKRA